MENLELSPSLEVKAAVSNLSKVAALWLPIALYILVTSVSFGVVSGDCDRDEDGLSEQMCTEMSVSADVYKEYYGVIEMPVYFAGYNIELLNQLVILYSAAAALFSVALLRKK